MATDTVLAISDESRIISYYFKLTLGQFGNAKIKM